MENEIQSRTTAITTKPLMAAPWLFRAPLQTVPHSRVAEGKEDDMFFAEKDVLTTK